MIAILDYDAGNLHSVENALRFLGGKVCVTRKPTEILAADGVILPGVGAFGDAMQKLAKYELIDVIHEVVKKQTPFLGICLGLQLLFEESEESPGAAGLGLLQGSVRRIPDGTGLKIPHIGWNDLSIRPGSRLFAGIAPQSYVYFVHSYYLQAKDAAVVAATTEYGTTIHAAVEKDNLFACQFHPEKSGEVGLQILKNFIQLCKEEE